MSELWTVVGASGRPFTEMSIGSGSSETLIPGLFLFYFAWFKIVSQHRIQGAHSGYVAGVFAVLYLLFGPNGSLPRNEQIISALSGVAVPASTSSTPSPVKQYSAMITSATIST